MLLTIKCISLSTMLPALSLYLAAQVGKPLGFFIFFVGRFWTDLCFNDHNERNKRRMTYRRIHLHMYSYVFIIVYIYIYICICKCKGLYGLYIHMTLCIHSCLCVWPYRRMEEDCNWKRITSLAWIVKSCGRVRPRV